MQLNRLRRQQKRYAGIASEKAKEAAQTAKEKTERYATQAKDYASNNGITLDKIKMIVGSPNTCREWGAIIYSLIINAGIAVRQFSSLRQ